MNLWPVRWRVGDGMGLLESTQADSQNLHRNSELRKCLHFPFGRRNLREFIAMTVWYSEGCWKSHLSPPPPKTSSSSHPSVSTTLTHRLKLCVSVPFPVFEFVFRCRHFIFFFKFTAVSERFYHGLVRSNVFRKSLFYGASGNVAMFVHCPAMFAMQCRKKWTPVWSEHRVSSHCVQSVFYFAIITAFHTFSLRARRWETYATKSLNIAPTYLEKISTEHLADIMNASIFWFLK